MKDWAAEVSSLIRGIGNDIQRAARTARSAFDDDPYEVLAYRGFGNGIRAHIYGRALEKRALGVSTGADSTLRNLLNTWRRADSDPLAFARVAVEHSDTKTEMQADDEGFFGGWVDIEKPAASGDEWQDYAAELVAPVRPDSGTVKGKGEILVPPATALFGVISDIDDTVIQSRVSNFLQAARTVMLGNARTRLPFPGVAAFYQALRNGIGGHEKNPIFYVSSSPWNIYDVISEFMDIQKIPHGPLLLRDWDIGLSALSSSHHFGHKGLAIRNIMQLYPAMQFILIGDTSQHDPEIYRQIVGEFPDRVKAIYIRDVTRTGDRTSAVKKLADEVIAAHSILVLSEDTLGAAKHAAEQGWISQGELPKVQEEKRADEGRDDTKVATPDGGEPTSGTAPTVIE